jgi:1-acyl-sn-glycerol-3-phosphate acyltransferase
VRWLRPLLLAVLVTLLTGGLALLSLLAWPVDPSRRLGDGISRIWGRATLWLLGVEVEVDGASNVVPGPAVYAANHATAVDIPVLFAHLPVRFRIIYKSSLAWVPLLGLCLLAAGHVAIDRRRGARARRSLERAVRRIRAGTSVMVFPEGTRSPDGRVGHFKRGSFLLAIEAGVPVVPVSLVGMRQVAPCRGLVGLRPGRVRLLLHPPVPTAGATGEDLAARVRDQVASAVEAPA